MNGGGEEWIDNPWDPWTWYIVLGLALIGAGRIVIEMGGQIDGGYG